MTCVGVFTACPFVFSFLSCLCLKTVSCSVPSRGLLMEIAEPARAALAPCVCLSMHARVCACLSHYV